MLPTQTTPSTPEHARLLHACLTKQARYTLMQLPMSKLTIARVQLNGTSFGPYVPALDGALCTFSFARPPTQSSSRSTTLGTAELEAAREASKNPPTLQQVVTNGRRVDLYLRPCVVFPASEMRILRLSFPLLGKISVDIPPSSTPL